MSHPPLKERSTNALCTVPPYKSERKNWTEERMERGIKSITWNGVSVRRAAADYNRLSGKVPFAVYQNT